MKWKFGLAAAALLYAGAAPNFAFARDLPAGGVTIEEVAAWLKQSGLTARIHTEKSTQNGPILSTSIDDVATDIYLYDCTANRCRALQYASGWDDSARPGEKINEWNADHRYLRVYQADQTNLWAEYDVDVAPGGTYEQLGGALTRFRESIKSFKTFFGI
jgi:Putative bacterial sensory transduction regulator